MDLIFFLYFCYCKKHFLSWLEVIRHSSCNLKNFVKWHASSSEHEVFEDFYCFSIILPHLRSHVRSLLLNFSKVSCVHKIRLCNFYCIIFSFSFRVLLGNSLNEVKNRLSRPQSIFKNLFPLHHPLQQTPMERDTLAIFFKAI